MSIGSKLAQARRAANLTQEQLAERLGVTRQAVSRWESDSAYPETDKIVRMARLLKQAVGRKVQLVFYEEDGGIFSANGLPSGGDWCTIL